MRFFVFIALAASVCSYSAESIAASSDPCSNQARLERSTKAAYDKADRQVRNLENRFDNIQRSIGFRRISMENRRANFAAQVAAQETRMGTCDVTAGILTQIFNNRDITRGMCTANNIIGSIVGTVVDSFKCQLECSVISSDPYCVKRCESRIRGEQQRCERLAQSACVRAVALRVKDEVTVKQLASPLFNPDCEDTTPAACPNGQLRSILANVKKARVALGVAEMKANQASEALAACLGGQ